jgi:hypothetical protein
VCKRPFVTLERIGLEALRRAAGVPKPAASELRVEGEKADERNEDQGDSQGEGDGQE